MLKLRVIPCLDVKDGRVVKGVQFVDLVDAGDPVEAAMAYDAAGADELCFLDITASHENRDTIFDVVARTAEHCFMPVTVGGGIRKVEDIRKLLLAGADKVSINTEAVRRPDFIREGAEKFGSQCIVAAIDAKAGEAIKVVFSNTGTLPKEAMGHNWVLLKPGTDATVVAADGARSPLTGSVGIRATELTVGATGDTAMPGSLPPTSGYTYAVEYSIDEAGNAKSVEFDQPVISYTDNFIDAPVGSAVPTGWYDRVRHAWTPGPDGLVVRIVAVGGGVATLDIDSESGGDPGAETLAELAAGFGITEAEVTAELTRLGGPALHAAEVPTRRHVGERQPRQRDRPTDRRIAGYPRNR